jgi:hypothetical protein
MNELLEKYKCMNEACKVEWSGTVGPPNFCPKCKGMYCEWLTFKDWDFDGESWVKRGTSLVPVAGDN